MRTTFVLGALAALCTLAFGRTPSAGAALDLTGDWTYTMSGDYEGTCAVQLAQTGDDITGAFDCPGFDDDGSLTGTVSLVSGTLLLEGTVEVLVGGLTESWTVSTTVYPAGNTVTGEWESAEGYGGTMAGVRNVPIYVKGDLNCDGEITGRDVLSGMLWSLELDPIQQPDCPDIGADLGVIFGDVDCDLVHAQPDGMALLRYLAGIPLDLGPDCPNIGTAFSPAIPT